MSRLGRLSGLVLALGLGPIASCDEAEPPTSSPIDAAAEAQRRLQITGFVRALERERYFVSIDPEAPSLGASDPLVTIVAFVDYDSSETVTDEQLQPLLETHGEDLRVVIQVRGADVEQAKRLDIERRPTFFVNGVALVRSETESLSDVVAAELETAKRLLALGARRDEVYALLMGRAGRDRTEPPGPIEHIEPPWEPEFAVAALSSELRDGGVLVEDLVVGEGPAVVEGKIIEFEFKGYASASGKQVMGSREKPAKMVLNDAARKRDPIAAAMITAMLGMRVGGKRRIKVPMEIVEAGAPEGRPPIGHLWMAVELIAVSDAPKLEDLAVFTGKPIASTRHDDGLEISDYRSGKGPSATTGMVVTIHYVGQLADGTEFDSSHGRPEGLPIVVGTQKGVIAGVARGLEGARVGMLRKIVIPPELGYGDVAKDKIPANSTLIFFVQVMDVQPAKEVEAESDPA
jgi:FKBP-type peptidyl-prolyl cis-trans isomerase